MKLALRGRNQQHIETPLQSDDDFFKPGMFQTRLIELYRKFDILCYCQSEPVVMHIRHRTATDLYFVADNPTSTRHLEDCTFHSMRMDADEHHYDPSELKPLDAFHPYVTRAPSEFSKPSSVSKKSPISTALKTFSTLCENAFATYSFGRFVSFKDFVTKIANADKNKQLSTPWGKSVADCMHYGAGGLKIALANVQRYESVDKSIPTAIWFGYAPEGTQFEHGSVILKGERLTYTHLHNPYQAPGPHVLCGFIAQSNQESETVFRDLLMMPIVSSSYCLPVHNQAQREFALKYLPILFGLNNKKDVTYFIKKPLLPFIEAGNLVYTDWLLTKKPKNGSLNSVKTVVIEHGDRQAFLADVYGTAVLSPEEAMSSA